MKNLIKIITLFFMLPGLTAQAQDFAKVDEKVRAYKPSYSSLEDLARQIDTDFKRDDEKARAIFTWIATHVKYDLNAYGVNERPVAFSFRTQEEKAVKERKFKDDLALKTLKSKKGVCQGYATLFESLCDKLGLEAVIIPGTSKSHPAHIGKLPERSDHAWNAVKVNDEWKLVDVTWAAGTVTGQKPEFKFKFNDKYFFADPDDFFLNHYPDDEKWLLTQKDKEEFAQLPLYYGNYLMGGYEFISPRLGIIPTSKPVLVPFKIKNLRPGDRVAYAFSNNRVFTEVEPEQTGTTTEFTVPVDNQSAGYLTIYINQMSVVAYRINRS